MNMLHATKAGLYTSKTLLLPMERQGRKANSKASLFCLAQYKIDILVCDIKAIQD
jgi:hypothetical protein